MNVTELSGDRLSFFCPGCSERHTVDVTRWTWNGDTERPTLTPSILIRTGHFCTTGFKAGDPCWCTYNAEHPERPSSFVCAVCHSFVRDGTIEFLGDCTHALAGRTVNLAPVDEAVAAS